MKTSMFTKRFLGVFASIVTAFSLVFMAATPVFAAPLKQFPPITIRKTSVNSRADQLSAYFHHEVTWYTQLNQGPKFISRTLTNAQMLLLDSENIDLEITSPNNMRAREQRESTLASQNSAIFASIGRMQYVDTAAGALIASHPGFADGWTVVNPSLALMTVNTLNQYLSNLQSFENRTGDKAADFLGN